MYIQASQREPRGVSTTRYTHRAAALPNHEGFVKISTKANLMLLLVSAMWGASYPIVRMSVQDLSSNAFVLGRFALAALILFPLVARNLGDRNALRVGATLGAIEGSVCAILALNIGSMPASRCAFIMGTSVVLVPVWATLLGKHRLSAMDLLRATISLVGLYHLTGAHIEGVELPDLYIGAAAALWALNIVVLKEQTLKTVIQPKVLAFYQSLTTCGVPIVLMATGSRELGHLTWRAAAGLGYCAVFATVINLILQTMYQKHTSASQAALRLSLDPLFACIFSVMFFGESLNDGMILGGGLMMLATVLPELWEMVSSLLARSPTTPSEPLPVRRVPPARAAARRPAASIRSVEA